ncbi:dihydrolipoyl dehydrogenase family protein [Sphingomonas oligophenolica]|uniref:FAD-binding protein n=1 Tax=Sphingomonas oligophenolica TaxID=301154 RepID=A0A502CR98_9SPHN|nr:FAD-dependent oxidoreductase [Sphingomonas oligophenolica]TPG14326.1 FAD-binding protein [Sphingomonas oligophenolica]
MSERFDLIVIGAGSAGLTAAGGAAMFGLKVALVEAGAMGGECLNTGCVPSKALLAAAACAHGARDGARFGVGASPTVTWSGVRTHIAGAIAAIAPNDAQERFEAMGIDVIRTRAHFLDDRTLGVGNRRLTAPRIVIATGSNPAVPAIEGLADVPYLTNETIFSLDVLPDHLVILGGGAVGIEMAQAFRRLGAAVTVIAPHPPLARDDAEAAAVVLRALRDEGVVFETGHQATRIVGQDGKITVTLADGRAITGSHLLVATGRRANIADLDLASAGVEAGDDGIVVDAQRRSANKRIYAIGDCRAGPRLTHVAGYEGSLVALNIALGLPGKVDWRALPHVLYTDPELAQIGLTEAAAREKYGEVDVTRDTFADNDRAVTEGDTRGFLKLIRHRRRVVGVTIVGAHAGDLLLPWTQIITGKATAFALGSAIVAYPSLSEIAKAAAFRAYAPAVFGPWPKRWAGIVARTRRWRA